MPWSPAADAQPCHEFHQIQAYILVPSSFEARKREKITIISVETSDGSVNAWKCLERRRSDSGLLLIQARGANREKEQDMRLESSER